MQSERNITLSYTGGASYCDLTVNIFIFCLKLVHLEDLIYGLVYDVANFDSIQHLEIFSQI